MLALGIGCGDDDGGNPDADMDVGMPDTGTDTNTDAPTVTGCTNADATNYNPEATVDDGSCTFQVSFAVDMTAFEYERTDGVAVEGSFCSDDCPALSDDDEDEVWEGTAELVMGTYTYNFVVTSDPAVSETVPEFCRAAGETVRGFQISDAAVDLDPVAFGGCTVLPVVVDGFYAASGFFGDATTIEVTETCPERGGDGNGACRTWTYTRDAMGFAGAFWQFPENNFGAEPGFPMPRGATRVTFSAWGESGGEVVNFLVGFAPNAEFGERDGFERQSGDITLTDTPTDYSIDLVGQDYDLIAGGFGWVAGLADGAGPITFYIDDVQWERVPEDITAVRGCTDTDASNYDDTATVDDGSCVYPVTFQVDMSCPDPADAFATVSITGPFCDFCGSGFELTDGGGGIWTGTFDFPAGMLEFKYITNGFASQEDLIDDVAGGMGACAPVTDGATFANRRINVDSMPTTTTDIYGTCAAACP